MSKAFVIKAPVAWAFIFEAKEESYSIDLCNITAEQKMQILEAGVPAKRFNDKQDHRGTFITVRSTKKPVIKDSAGNTLTEKVILWPGSEAKVVVKAFDYVYKGTPGTSIGLEAVMITKVADAPEAEGGGDFNSLLIPEEGGGFTANKEATVFGDDRPKFDDLLRDEELEVAF